MPSLPPIPDGIQVVLAFTKANQQVRNVFHVRSDVAIDEALLNTCAQVFKNAWIDRLKGMNTPDVSLNSIMVTDISVVGGLGVEYTTGLPQVGTLAGFALPNNVTVATKLTTGHTGRSYRGRSYFVGIGNDLLLADRQHIADSLRLALGNFFADLLVNLPTDGMHLAIASRYSGVDANGKPIPRTAPFLTDVTGAVTNTTVDSQRRRLPERGS